ncbi:MAG: hypothetical protein ACO37W_18800 [Prochlorotrichaceae cyanobacterium]
MTKATKTNSAKPYRVLISRSALLDLVLEQDEGIARLFEVLQQNPKPFIPFLSDRALGDFQRLLELEEGVDAAALVRSFYDHFQILKVTMFHVRTANRLNWPDLERAIDYAVAMEQRLDAVVFLDPMEAKGTQELVMTVTPEGLLKRLELEGLWQEMEAEAEGSERDFLAQLLLLLVTGVLPEVSDQVEPAPRPTAIGEADQPVKANDQATDLQRSQESSGGGSRTPLS